MKWPSLTAAAAALAFLAPIPAHGGPWVPPTPQEGLVDEVGALSQDEAAQLRGMLADAVDRDGVRVVVLILEKSPPVPRTEAVKAVLARQQRAWLRALVCLSTDSAAPPLVGCDGPGTSELPADQLKAALATVRNNAANEADPGAQVLRYTADLLDELHRLRLAHPPPPATLVGRALAWISAHPAAAAALALAAAVTLAARSRLWRRHPAGLQFPAIPLPPRLGGPYAGGSRVSVDFDPPTIARSRERARR
jgi:hypothetical protein